MRQYTEEARTRWWELHARYGLDGPTIAKRCGAVSSTVSAYLTEMRRQKGLPTPNRDRGSVSTEHIRGGADLFRQAVKAAAIENIAKKAGTI
jgi:transposase